jgi:Flp pilus assembly protein TadB
MYIIAIAWIYVVFMMSITEVSVVAGVMTFLLYGMLPVGIIVYVMGTGQRKRRRQAKERQQFEDLQARQKQEDAALAATGDDSTTDR